MSAPAIPVISFQSKLRSVYTQNPVLQGFLGLCPLLAVSTSIGTALVMGLCTLLTLLMAVPFVAGLRRITSQTLRLPLFMLYIATSTLVLQLLLQASAYGAASAIGLFLPLIVTNCLVLARAEATYHGGLSILQSLKGAAQTGVSFAWIIVLIGTLRELLGQGKIGGGLNFSGLHIEPWKIPFFEGLPLFLLPAGAFFILAALMIIKRLLEAHEETTPIKP